ncbi:MAG: hypothetical protein AB7F75_05745 [Planctomycetota bacterium]
MWKPRGAPTGVGSLNFSDPDEAVRYVFRHFESLPFWPQLPAIAPLITTWFGRIPGARGEGNTLRLPWTRHNLLAGLRAHFDSRFRPRPLVTEQGYSNFTTFVSEMPRMEGQFFKGQIFGPVTLLSMLRDNEGFEVGFSDALLDLFCEYLIEVSVEMARGLNEAGGRPLIVIDEPILSHADPFIWQRLRGFVAELQKHARVGIHCCGPARWDQIVALGLDYVNFDAFTHLDHLIDYRDAFSVHVNEGGWLALGIVPTFPHDAPFTTDELFTYLRKCLLALTNDSVTKQTRWGNLVLTPSCGTALHKPQSQDRIYHTLVELSRRAESES